MLFQTRNGIGVPMIETFPELGASGCTSCQKNGVSLGHMGAGNVVQLQSQIPGANRGIYGLGLDPDVAAAISVQQAINTAAKTLNMQPGPEGGNIDAATLALAKRVVSAASSAQLALSASNKGTLLTILAVPNADVFDAMVDANGPALVSAFAAVANLAIDQVRNRPPGMPMAAKVAIGLGLAAGVVAIVMMARR